MKSWLWKLATVGTLALGALLVSNCSNRTGDRDTTTSRTDQTTPGYGGAGTQSSTDSKSPAGYPSQTPSTSDQTPSNTDPNRTPGMPDSIGNSTTGTPPSTYDTTGSSSNPDTSNRPERSKGP